MVSGKWYNDCFEWLMLMILWSFYRKAAWLLNFHTLFGCLLFYLHGSTTFLVPIVWTKVIVNVLTAAYILVFESHEFVFYRNLGFSKPMLFGGSFLIDITIWALLSFLTFLLQHYA